MYISSFKFVLSQNSLNDVGVRGITEHLATLSNLQWDHSVLLLMIIVVSIINMAQIMLIIARTTGV